MQGLRFSSYVFVWPLKIQFLERLWNMC